MRNSSSLDWLRFMHTPNDYRVSPDSSIWKCPIRWLFQSPFKKPPIALYFTHLQQFALIIFRSKNILLHTCLNVMEIAEKEKQKRFFLY